MKKTIELILTILAIIGMFVGIILTGAILLHILIQLFYTLLHPTMDIVYFIVFVGLIGFVIWSGYYLNNK